MSGPIIRKYGFPNFEKIFGAETPKHGAEDEKNPSADPKSPAPNSESSSTHLDPSKRATTTDVSPPTELGSAVD